MRCEKITNPGTINELLCNILHRLEIIEISLKIKNEKDFDDNQCEACLKKI